MFSYGEMSSFLCQQKLTFHVSLMKQLSIKNSGFIYKTPIREILSIIILFIEFIDHNCLVYKYFGAAI